MSKLTGKVLAFNCFSWPEGKKADGSFRAAGQMKAFTVLEEGPTLATNTVVEVQVPDDLHSDFDSKCISWKPLQHLEIHVTHTGKGRAKLLSF